MVEKMIRVMPYMCQQQKDELQYLLTAADDIGEAATSVAHGGQGYTQLIEARDRFKNLLVSCSTHYRIFEEVEVV